MICLTFAYRRNYTIRSQSDRIREQLQQMGITLIDRPNTKLLTVKLAG